jgi:hypothetical protein
MMLMFHCKCRASSYCQEYFSPLVGLFNMKEQSESYQAKEKTNIWVARGTGTPNDRDEVNIREVCECENPVNILQCVFLKL